MALFSVLFDIAAKTADFESGIARVDRKLGNLASTAKQAAQLIGGYFAAEKLFSSLDDALERAAGLKHFAESAGVATEALSKLEFAAKQVGLGNEQLEVGLKKFNVAVNGAAHGVAASSAAFDALGISVTDAKGHTKDMHDILLEVAQRFSETQDGSGKAAVAVALFGRAGEMLIPLLNKGASGLKEMGDQAERAGLVISEQTAAAAEKLHERLGVLEAGIKQGLTNAIISNLLPSMSAFSNSFNDSKASVASTAELVDQVSDGLRVLATVALAVGDTFEAMGKYIGATLADVNAAMHGNFAQMKIIDSELHADLLAQEADYQKRSKAIWTKGDSDILQEITLASKKIKSAINFDPKSGNGKSEALEEIKLESAKRLAIEYDYVEQLAAVYKRSALERLHATVAADQALVDEIKRTHSQLDDIARGAAQNMQGAFEKFFYAPSKAGLAGLLTAFLDTVRQMIAQAAAAKLMSALFGAPGASGQAGSGFFGSILGAVFGGGKAAGGPVQSGTTYLVGEKGPELFTPGANGAITPNGHGQQGGGGDVVSITINQPIDARGAQEGTPAQISKALAENNATLKQDIIEGLRRRKYRV